MRERTSVWLAVAVGLSVLASAARAQEEQWLQYRSAREAESLVGEMPEHELALSFEKPAGLGLPELKGDQPLFAKWPSPMVANGYLWLAIDRTDEHGPYDKLFIDSNGNGDLKDEAPAAVCQQTDAQGIFGPAKVLLKGEDGPVAYHLNFRLYWRSKASSGLFVGSGGWYEGTIAVAGVKKHWALIDYNANGTFNDKSVNPDQADQMRIGPNGGADCRFVGNYVQIDDELYSLAVARDGACVKLGKAAVVVFGTVRVSESVTEFAAGGENGLLSVRLEKGVGRLPVGKYRIHHWRIERKDPQGVAWRLEATRGQSPSFDVTQSGQVDLQVGEPLISALTVSKADATTYLFDHKLKGRLGENIVVTRNGPDRPAPKLHIKNKDGSYSRTLAFEFG